MLLLYQQTQKDLAESALMQLDVFTSVAAVCMGGDSSKHAIKTMREHLAEILGGPAVVDESPDAVRANREAWLARMSGFGLIANN